MPQNVVLQESIDKTTAAYKEAQRKAAGLQKDADELKKIPASAYTALVTHSLSLLGLDHTKFQTVIQEAAQHLINTKAMCSPSWNAWIGRNTVDRALGQAIKCEHEQPEFVWTIPAPYAVSSYIMCSISGLGDQSQDETIKLLRRTRIYYYLKQTVQAWTGQTTAFVLGLKPDEAENISGGIGVFEESTIAPLMLESAVISDPVPAWPPLFLDGLRTHEYDNQLQQMKDVLKDKMNIDQDELDTWVGLSCSLVGMDKHVYPEMLLERLAKMYGGQTLVDLMKATG